MPLEMIPTVLGMAFFGIVAVVGDILIGRREKKGSGTFCLKGPKGAAHKMYLTPFSPKES